MKRYNLNSIGKMTFVISMAAMVFAGVASAQNNEQSLAGSWDLRVTLRDCSTGFGFVTISAMNTYNEGGTSMQSAEHEPGASPLTGHGIWDRASRSSYTGAFRFMNLNMDGTPSGKVIVRSAITLAKDGNSYTSTDSSEVYLANGDLLLRGCSTSIATRFQ